MLESICGWEKLDNRRVFHSDCHRLISPRSNHSEPPAHLTKIGHADFPVEFHLPESVFTSEVIGPPRLRLWLYSEDYFGNGGRTKQRSWRLIVDRMEGNQWEPYISSLQDELIHIGHVLSDLRLTDAIWRSEATGQIVDLDLDLYGVSRIG